MSGPVGGAGELRAHELAQRIINNFRQYAANGVLLHPVHYLPMAEELERALAAKAPQGVPAPKPAPPAERPFALDEIQFTPTTTTISSGMARDLSECRPEGCICSEAYGVGPEQCGRHATTPAPGAERFAALPAKICKGILFYPYDEGSYYEWALGRVERLVREALAAAPGAERPDIKSLAKSLRKFVEEYGCSGGGEEWKVYLEEYQAENWLREALAAAPPAPVDELADLREEMKGMVDASWKDACIGWQRDICAAVGLEPVNKSVLLATLRDRHASAERVRRVTAKWDQVADAIDDGTGTTPNAIRASQYRVCAKQIDEAMERERGSTGEKS